ncbi:MAG: thioredoxin family protein [Deltaproteobacteria bacterium]|nr:thioredoxin family protein [Deltaproteobacteria bacterium]
MSRPAIFAELELDAALAQAASEKKLLLVDATASWCGPCKTMDRTTWVDPAVIDALREKALAIQIDVDAKADVAKKLNIMAMPTVIAFRDGAEIDRVVGLHPRDELLAWLDGLAHGETSLQRQRAEVASNPGDMQERMALAQMLVSANQLDEATKEYLWLWEHMLEHEPAMKGVRRSFLVMELYDLAAKHPPAREALARVRDAVAPRERTALRAEGLADWFSLNDALGERSRGLEWFDATRPKAGDDKLLAWLLESQVVPMLIEANRWADAGALFAQPLKTLEEAVALLNQADHMPSDTPPGFREFATKNLREVAGQLVRALRAAHRDEEAKAVAAEARKLDDSAEMSAALGDAESEPV